MKLRSLCLPLVVALTGCSKLLGHASPEDAGTDAGAAVQAAASASASSAPAASADAGAPQAGATVVYSTFSGQTSAKSTFRIAFERSGSDVRAVFDTGTPIAMIGRMSDDTHFSLRSAKVPKGEKPATLSGQLTEKSLKATFVDPGGKSQSLASGSPIKLPATFEAEYLGKIGKQFVRMKLSHRADTLSGIYRYAASTSDLHLDGIVHDDGVLELTEKANGKTTGKIVGAFATKGAIVGQWQSPDGSRSAPLSLEAGSGYPESGTFENGISLYPQEKMIEGKRCKTDVVFPQLRGGADAKALKEVNDYLRGDGSKAKSCEGPDDPQMPDFETSEGYSLDTHKGRFIGVRRSGYAFAGGAHGISGSVCDVIDTKGLKHFKLASKLSDAGRAKLGGMVAAALAKEHGVTKLTDAGFYDDKITITDKSDLCLGQGWIEVAFDAYELGPYALGPQEARIPAAQVKDLFTKDEETDAMFGSSPAK